MPNDIPFRIPSETPEGTINGISENGRDVIYRTRFFDLKLQSDGDGKLSIIGAACIAKLIRRENPWRWQSDWKKVWTLQTDWPATYAFLYGSYTSYRREIINKALQNNMAISEALLDAAFAEPVRFLEALHSDMVQTMNNTRSAIAVQ